MSEESHEKKTRSGLAKKLLTTANIIIVTLLVVLGILVLFLIEFYSDCNGRVTKVDTIDAESSLFYCEYTGEYENSLINTIPMVCADFGCTTFIAQDNNGKILTGRNFDYNYDDEGREDEALNMIVKINNQGNSNGLYSSLNMVDLKLLRYFGLNYTSRELQADSIPHVTMGLFPYFCMDGVNEKGVSCSILELDLKQGEKAPDQYEKGKPYYCITEMLRSILDKCANLQEAEELAKNSNFLSVFNTPYHLFVTDANGASSIFEWRNNQFTSTHIDLSTNFWNCSDDAQDYYNQDGKLVEKYVQPVSKYNNYRYGYGHGYNRFGTVLQTLDATRTAAGQLGKLSEAEAMNCLKSVSQEPNPDDYISDTLFSVVYNNTDKKMNVCSHRYYDKQFTFNLDN